jgi:hypothetical protein
MQRKLDRLKTKMETTTAAPAPTGATCKHSFAPHTCPHRYCGYWRGW